ncbi:MAG TPA: GNAT family N-acetyltransferase [Spirochaetota bacterium]|nr:GNAT family N-acetyltransferase [Spirochaetota bacterium]HQL44511.1 GNAT family N-acetyltransferase [Spirochaetota bacterium]
MQLKKIHNDIYQSKKINFNKLYEIIKPGYRLFLSSGPAMPICTVEQMIKSDATSLQDLEIIQLITLGDYLKTGEHQYKYRLKTFNTGESISKDIEQGKADFVPAHLVAIPFIFSSRAIGVDVAIIQTSPPDHRGFMSLGIAIDIANIVIENAKIVIAEVNPHVPITMGDTAIHIDAIDYILESDVPLIERDLKQYDPMMDKIGWHVANLIDDGSVVALHVGRQFDAIARHLHTKRELKVYSHVVSDWIIDLIESKALKHDRGIKNLAPVTLSYCYGTRMLYDYVDHNPNFEFLPLMRLTYPTILQRIPKLVSVMNVKKIDISGESVVFYSGDNLLSGYESKLNFAVGAAFSRGGKAIVALRSVDQHGDSNIVIRHTETEQVRSMLGVTRYVVSEYGVANLFGKSIRERALALIDIAHPNHRLELLNQAKEAGLVYPDQVYVIKNIINYPITLETMKTFKDGLVVKFRPIKLSDEDMMRRLFYQFSDESKYLRYFARIRTMPHKQMQSYVNIDYDKILAIVGIIEHAGTERIIAEARYAYDENDKSYEMAFIVDEEFQGKGIATFLARYLMKIAKERKIERVSANVLPQNDKMIKVFEKCGVPYTQRYEDGVMHFDFNLKKAEIML